MQLGNQKGSRKRRCRWGRKTYLWNLGERCHFQERGSWTWIFETLESCDGGGGTDVFLDKRGGRGTTGNVPAEKKKEIFITFARG